MPSFQLCLVLQRSPSTMFSVIPSTWLSRNKKYFKYVRLSWISGPPPPTTLYASRRKTTVPAIVRMSRWATVATDNTSHHVHVFNSFCHLLIARETSLAPFHSGRTPPVSNLNGSLFRNVQIMHMSYGISS